MHELVSNLLRQVQGTLTPDACEAVMDLSSKVTYEDQSKTRITKRIIDFYPGNGRSTILIASTAKDGVSIVTVDPHRSSMTRDGLSPKTGTLHNYFNSLKTFCIRRKIISIIATEDDVDDLFSKRSADLIVFQVPDDMGRDEGHTLSHAIIDLASEVLRTGGRLLMSNHHGHDTICDAGLGLTETRIDAYTAVYEFKGKKK